MAIAPDSQRRRLRGLELLQPAHPSPASPLSDCLDELQNSWREEGNLATLWKEWNSIAGNQLASHCQPLNLYRGVLTIGASHPKWRQALQYNRIHMLRSLKRAGHQIFDIRIRQHHVTAKKLLESELNIWERHPSRTDIHGMGECPNCLHPAPNGEINLWKECGLCHSKKLRSQ